MKVIVEKIKNDKAEMETPSPRLHVLYSLHCPSTFLNIDDLLLIQNKTFRIFICIFT